MIKLTKSLTYWLIENGYQKELVLIAFGHNELLTDDMKQRYLAWCETDDGKQYIKVHKS